MENFVSVTTENPCPIPTHPISYLKTDRISTQESNIQQSYIQYR